MTKIMSPNRTIADVAKTGIQLFKPLEPAEVARLESKLGRKLHISEIMSGEIARVDDRVPAERMAAQSRAVKMSSPKLTVIEAAIAEAERELGEERLRSMTPGERKLAMLREAKKAEDRLLADQTAHQARLQTLKPQIDRLQALRDRVRFDPEWSMGDVEALDHALDSLTTANADLPEAMAAYNAAIAVERTKTAAKRDAIGEKLQMMNLEKATLDAAMDRLTDRAEEISDEDEDAPAITEPHKPIYDRELWAKRRANVEAYHRLKREAPGSPEAAAAQVAFEADCAERAAEKSAAASAEATT